MKNIIRKLLLLICIMMLPFTLTACSGSKNNDNSAKSNNSEDKNADSDGSGSDNASETEAAGKYPSIQEFIDSDLFQEEMKPQISEFEEEGMTMSFSAEDNKLIWDFKINDPDLSAALDTASLESALDSQASTFESVAEVLPTAVDVDDPVVVARYLDSEGTVLASGEFTTPDSSNGTDSGTGSDSSDAPETDTTE